MNNTNQSARRRFDADFAVSARIRQMRNLPAGSTSLPLNIPAR